ncbi:MAG: type VI secretion system TssO [Ferruginibacter sp.]
MQQILNSRDRNQAFLKFSLFFIITIVLVVVAVYFNFNLPVKENKFLTNELANHRAQDEKEAGFIEKMDKVVAMLSSMEKSADSAKMFTTSVTNGISEMRDRKDNSNMFYNKMNDAFIRKFTTLNDKLVSYYTEAENRNKINALRTSLRELIDKLPEQQQAAAKQAYADQIEYLPAQ